MFLSKFARRHASSELEESGVSIIEFVLCFPLVAALVAGICDCGLVLSRYVTLQSEAASVMRFVEVFTSPSYESALTDLNMPAYSTSDGLGFIKFFDKNDDYKIVKTNSDSSTADLYSLIMSKLENEYGKSLCKPERTSSDPNEDNKWNIDVSITSRSDDKLIGGTNGGGYDEMLSEAPPGKAISKDVEGKTEFTYYLATGASNPTGGWPREDEYYERVSNFDNVDVQIVITYKDRFIFPLPLLLDMAAEGSSSSSEGLKSGEYRLMAKQVGTFYIGGNNW